jgi:hypothetical protein
MVSSKNNKSSVLRDGKSASWILHIDQRSLDIDLTLLWPRLIGFGQIVRRTRQKFLRHL